MLAAVGRLYAFLFFSIGIVTQAIDIDIASFHSLSLALGDQVEPDLPSIFKDFSFEAMPTVDRHKVWRWRQTRGEVLVEFLTPSFQEDEPILRLDALGIEAQSLHFLNYLIARPIKAAVPYRSGILVQIPQPARFAIHKLIVSERLTERLKAAKDRQQAALLIEAMKLDFGDDLRDAYATALDQGPKWRKHIADALEKMPETRTILAP